MKFQHFLSLAMAMASPATAAQICGTTGSTTTPPHFISPSPDLHHAKACGQSCVSDVKCQSFAVGLGMCLHYPTTLSSTFEKDSESPWLLNDRDCLVNAETPNAGKGASPFDMPDDNCAIDPNSNSSMFYLIGPDFVPLIYNKTQLQYGQAFGEKEIEAMYPDGSLAKVPVFLFKKSETAVAGLYDILLIGSERQFLGKAADGRLVLTSASTGSTGKDVNGQVIATSIFTVSCHGNVGVLHDGVAYSWNLFTEGTHTSFSAGAHSTNITMLALDTQFLDSASDLETQPELELQGLSRRDNPLHRCPGPWGGTCQRRAGVPAPSSNGCGREGPRNKLVPEYLFNACCDAHDLCYDNCTMNFYRCNDEFRTCMMGKCNGHFHGIFAPIGRAACKVMARIYYGTVSGPFGSSAFKEITHAGCECCRHPPNECQTPY